MYWTKEVKKSPVGRARVGGAQNTGGLVFSNTGLTPRRQHPGQENPTHPHIAMGIRELQEHREAFLPCYENTIREANAHDVANTTPTPSHPTNEDPSGASGQLAVEERHLGRSQYHSNVDYARGSLLVGSNTPRALRSAEHPQARSRVYPGMTSEDQSEAVLRRLLEDPNPLYRDAAQKALAYSSGPAELIAAEKRISHHKASKAYADECAERQKIHSSANTKRWEREPASWSNAHRVEGAPAVHFDVNEVHTRNERHTTECTQPPRASPLGQMTPRLAQTTPFALMDSSAPKAVSMRPTPRSYNNVTGQPLPNSNYSSPTLLWDGEGNGRGSGGGRSGNGSVAKEESTGNRCENKKDLYPSAVVKEVPAPFTTAPYDNIPSTEEVHGRYPAPPPVGVRTGLWNKPLLVHHVYPGESQKNTPDQDTLDSCKAQNARNLHEKNSFRQSSSVGNTVICGSSMAGCEENLSEFNRQYNPRTTNTLPSRRTAASVMEERCHEREREVEERKRGKRAHPYPKTSLW